jgi:hypothetical protein
MGLTPFSIMLEMVRCDFCGSEHVSERDAATHGCVTNPPKYFTVGQIVVSRIVFGPPPHLCAHLSFTGKIASISPPVHRRRDDRAVFRAGCSDHITVQAPCLKHDWVVEIEPLTHLDIIVPRMKILYGDQASTVLMYMSDLKSNLVPA